MADWNFTAFKEIGKSAARIVLPKPWEEALGLSAPEPKLEDQSYTNRLRTTQEAAFQGVSQEPRVMENRIREIITQEIQAGNYDSNLIKNAVRRNLQMDINNQILSKVQPPEASLEGFVANAKRNTKEIIDGFGVLLGLPVEAAYNIITDPVGSAKATWNASTGYVFSPEYREKVNDRYLDPILAEYAEYRNPGKKIYEDPVDAFLDATAIFGLIAKGLTTTGRAATKGTPLRLASGGSVSAKAIRLARQTLRTSTDPAALRAAAQTVAKSRAFKAAGATATRSTFAARATQAGKAFARLSTPLAGRNISAVTRGLIGKLPGGDVLLRNWSQQAATRATLTKAQRSFINARNVIITKIDDVVGTLTDAEIKAIPAALEGFTPIPRNMRPEFYRAIALFKQLAKDSERLGMKAGALTPDIVTRRRWQPLANFLERERGVSFTQATKVNRAALQEVTSKASKSLERASKKLADGKITQKQFNKIKRGIDEKVQKAYAKFEDLLIEEGFSSLTGDELRAQIGTIKTFFPEADPIYMRHFFSDKPRNFGEFFLNTQPVRTYKPGSLKKTYNRDGYIGQTTDITREQLQEILERQAIENIKFESNMKLINDLITDPDTLPLRAGEQPLEGYTIFAPDGMLRFYRGTIDLAEELSRRLQKAGGSGDVWDMFGDVVDNLFGDANVKLNKSYLGVTKAKLYQVPTAKAVELQKNVRPTNPYVKIFYDQPLDAFRFTALSLYPRWQFNNIVGNAVFSIVSGDVFNPKAFYIYRQAKKKAGVLPDELFGGIHATERTTSGKLGGAIDRIPWVKSTIEMHDHLLQNQTIGRFVRNAEATVGKAFKPLIAVGEWSFRFNQAVDDMFKGTAFINRALKAERRNFMQRLLDSTQESMRRVEKANLNQKGRQALIDDVHNWYYYGLNLTDFERRVMRRAIPFYSWMRWSTLYTYRIATEAPIRANILSNMTQGFYMMTGQDQLPEWMRGSVPIGNDEDGTVYYLRTSGMNPFSTINDLMSEGIVGAALRGAAPAPKTFIEQATGRDVFLGERFTREDVIQAFNGDLYRFDPELGKVVKIEDNSVKPALIENLMRNYLPQYLLAEVVLSGGNRRYTAEGLDEILKDVFRDPGERKAIIEDIITKQPVEGTSYAREFGKALGINVMPVKPEQEVSRREAMERATKAILNREIPLMNENFKKLIQQRVIDELQAGTPRDEIDDRVKEWIGYNVDELKKLQ